MSRIDEKSAETRAEEARAQDRRNQDRLTKQRTAESTAFDIALQRGREPGAAATRAQVPQSEKPGFKDALRGKEPAEEQSAALPGELSADAEAAADPRLEKRATRRPVPFGARPPAGKSEAGRPDAGKPEANLEAATSDLRPEKQKQQGQALTEQLSKGKPGVAAEARAEAFTEQTLKDGDFGRTERQSDTRNSDTSQQLASGGGRKQAPVGRAGERQGGSGSGDGQQPGGKEQKESSFRMPPAALMAPPPLARPREGTGAAGLRAATKEIVEKIVSRVLVGHNDKGMAEFRIDLKSDVLKGLSIKVSGGRGGKIRAVFSGTDREALKALKGGSSELISALASKGLTLESLDFEDA